MKQYHIFRNNEQSGPMPEQHVHEKIANGELTLSDMCWCEGMSDWCSIQKAFKLPPPPPGSPGSNAAHASAPSRSLATDLRELSASVNNTINAKRWLRVSLKIIACIVWVIILVKFILPGN